MAAGYYRLYSIQQGDVWGGYILDQVAPMYRDNIDRNNAFSTLDEAKYGNKSTFLKSFYKGKSPNF